MNKLFLHFIIFLFFFIPTYSHALFIEMGLSHSYKKTTFSTNNYIESETLSGSVSFYIWDQVALETSYTQGYAIRKENDSLSPIRTITQNTNIYGMDFVFGFAGRTAVFQPFIKAGTAYISKKQVVADEGNPSYTLNPKSGLAPSYGFGFKIKLTETFSLTTSVDIWQTPLDDGSKTNDVATRSGISWLF